MKCNILSVYKYIFPNHIKFEHYTMSCCFMGS